MFTDVGLPAGIDVCRVLHGSQPALQTSVYDSSTYHCRGRSGLGRQHPCRRFTHHTGSFLWQQRRLYAAPHRGCTIALLLLPRVPG